MSEYHAMREFSDGEGWCWFLLNSGTRACIKERGHDAGIHEGPSAKHCGDERTPHQPHVWAEKHQCEGTV